MTLTIAEDSISSDRSPHTARHAPGGEWSWEVSWLPGRLMDRNAAITAMVLADVTGPGNLPAGDQLWVHVGGWAAELGLTTPEVLTRLARPPGRASEGKDTVPADPEAAG